MKAAVDYRALKDAEVVKAFHERNMIVPLNEDGRVLRDEAIRQLMDRDEQEALNDTSERVWVVFHNSGNPSAGPYVFASINNRNFQAPYEKEVCIPRYFLTECIDRANTVVYRCEDQADGSIAAIPTKIPTYSYTVLRKPVESSAE